MSIREIIKIDLGERSYDVNVGKGLLSEIGKIFNLKRRTVIVTDSGVPREYSEAVAKACENTKIITFPEGEESKSLDTFAFIQREMLSFGLQRGDAVIAVGGGVVGDIAGFAAATYMRGIDFYNVPTTLLSEVDSSIGGKTAIDFRGVKNIIGAFHQPKGVLIDPDVLRTLPKRQIASGLAEVIKMAMTSDKALFERLESGIDYEDLTDVIVSALKIKKAVVEADERESGLRRILNFGHTYGHGIEALGGYFHGECVALGMIPMCAPNVRARLLPLLCSVGLPTEFKEGREQALLFAKSDKKGDGDTTYVITVSEIGKAVIEKLTFDELKARVLSCE